MAKKKAKAKADDEPAAVDAAELERLRAENAELRRRVETVEAGKCPSCDAALADGKAQFDAAAEDSAERDRLVKENAELVARLAAVETPPAAEDVGILGRFVRGE